MTMKIEVGKCYRTRDGQKVGPMIDRNPQPWDRTKWRDYDGKCWHEDGRHFTEMGAPNLDLIAEWTDPPDLTALTTPFGLLDRDTQEALKAHGGPWERYSDKGKWEPSDHPCWYPGNAYRVKTAPPKPREWWIVEWSDGDTQLYSSNDDAEDAARSLERNGWHNVKIIHVIKKLPD